ncbi:NTF2 fold immunity protein [Burkholderia gladioli]|uniref:NTF2 fold immunity protein n=1 Tax=Burkholderia gladioli TaxID=28095 RepID=UPI0016417FAD|nr:NTF2 fold immunity protein [Burkholderia gladioli]
MESNDPAALQRLKEFTQAMHEWETKFYSLMRKGGQERHIQASDELRPIFEKYVVNRNKNFSRVYAPSAAEPPEYDNDHVVIEDLETTDRSATILVRKNSFPQGLFKYILINDGGRWLLQKKEKYSPSKETWSPYHF